jgi:hypothetical protein
LANKHISTHSKTQQQNNTLSAKTHQIALAPIKCTKNSQKDGEAGETALKFTGQRKRAHMCAGARAIGTSTCTVLSPTDIRKQHQNT